MTWTGDDPLPGAGIQSFDLFVPRDGQSYSLWQIATTNRSAPFTGQSGATYRFHSRARDAAGNLEPAPGTPDAITTVTSGLSFATWAKTAGLSGDLAGPGNDPDADGLSNLTEYALALDPLQPDADRAAPRAGLIQVRGRHYLVLTYRRSKTEPADLRYRVTGSTVVSPWANSSAVEPAGQPVDRGGYIEVTVRSILPIDSAPQGFLRLMLEQ